MMSSFRVSNLFVAFRLVLGFCQLGVVLFFGGVGCQSKVTVFKAKTVHGLHGEERVDNYHWMKDTTRKDPKVLEHLKAENSSFDDFLEDTQPLQNQLYKEFLSRLQEADEEVPYHHRGFFYYSKTIEGKEYPVFCRKRGSLDAEEQVVLDPNLLGHLGENVSVGSIKVSPDQSLIAYTVDGTGSEVYRIYFKDLLRNKVIEPFVENSTTNVVWSEDNQFIFFTRMDEAFRNAKVYRYSLKDLSETLVYEELDPLFDVWIRKTRDHKYLLMGVDSYVGTEISFLDGKTPEGKWTVIQPRIRGLEYSVEHHKGLFYVYHNNRAENFKISTVSVRRPGAPYWKDYVPHSQELYISDFVLLSDYLVYEVRHEGATKIRYVDFKTRNTHEIPFDENVYQVEFGTNKDSMSQYVRLRYQSPLTPPKVLDFDLSKGEKTLKKQTRVPNYDASLYETKRIFVQARDGAEIPVTLHYKKGFVRNGKAPALLYGYGSYGITLDADFDAKRLSLLDRGFLYAIAHIRGGQSKGRRWYESGRLLQKKNTFYDFIDVARGLVGAKYTSSNSLVIEGRSAGGLLVGAVVNWRPDLFRVAVATVPFVDVLSTLLDKKLRFSTQEYEQWGDPNQKGAYQYIRDYSPYDNIVKQSYPSILAIAGLHDTRVNFWEPAKWVAKLREYTQSDAPIFLRTQMSAGHRGSHGRYGQLKERAEKYAYILKSLKQEIL